jgi:hypothetical protein
VPPGRELTPLDKLLFPFTLIVWILLLSCIVFAIVVIIAVECHSKSLQSFIFGERVRNPILNILNALLGGAQHQLPRGTFARFLLMNFLLFTLNVRTLYQGSMYHLMQSNRKYSELQSIDEIVADELKIYVLKLTSDMFSQHSQIGSR